MMGFIFVYMGYIQVGGVFVNECEVCERDCWNDLPCGCYVICDCKDYVKEWLDNEID